MELLVFLFLLVLFLLVRSRLSVDRPGALQHTFEGIEGFIQSQSDEIIGHHSEAYTAFLAALGFFILFCNLIGVIPGFESPTAVPIVPLGCAICAFVYYQTRDSSTLESATSSISSGLPIQRCRSSSVFHWLYCCCPSN